MSGVLDKTELVICNYKILVQLECLLVGQTFETLGAFLTHLKYLNAAKSNASIVPSIWSRTSPWLANDHRLPHRRGLRDAEHIPCQLVQSHRGQWRSGQERNAAQDFIDQIEDF